MKKTKIKKKQCAESIQQSSKQETHQQMRYSERELYDDSYTHYTK